jgi:hypothetical protein
MAGTPGRMHRFPLLAALLAAVLLAVPTSSLASDRSFAQVAISGAKALGKREAATNRALQAVSRRGRPAVPAARRRIGATVRSVDRLVRAVRRENPSSGDGRSAKRRLLKVLGVERRALGRLDAGLVALRRGAERRAVRLIRRATRELNASSREAAKVGDAIGELTTRSRDDPPDGGTAS